MFRFTRRTGKKKEIAININEVISAHIDRGIIWYNMRTEFGPILHNHRLQIIRESPEWAEAVKLFAIERGLNVEELLRRCIKSKQKPRNLEVVETNLNL